MPEDLDDLLARIARLEREHPRRHRVRVVLLALLGEAYLAGVFVVCFVLLLLSLVPLLATGFLLWPLVAALAAAAWLALRASSGRPPEPVGLPLDATSAPALVALVEEVRARLRAPRLSRILLTPEVGAAVVDLPAGMFFGWRPVLLLGLPLLHALHPDELRAVLGHEIGHLARKHGRLLAWIWRVRQSWARIHDEMNRQGRAAAPFRAFARWYVPRFSAWSFALARAQELEADRLAASVTTPRIAGDALTRAPLLHSLVERDFWPAMRRRARDGEPVSPHAELSAFARAPLSEAAGPLLEAALSAEPRPGDAHPPLGVRLMALGVAARLPPPPGETAADRYLGDCAGPAARLLDAAWLGALSAASSEEADMAAAEEAAPLRVQRRELAGRRRAELRARRAERELEPSETWELAMVVGELEGPAEERALLEELLGREPDHAPTCFELGRLRLRAGDESGADLLQRAGELDPALSRRTARMLLASAETSGNPGRASELRRRIAEGDAVEELASEERSLLPWARSHYRRAEVSEEIVRALRPVVAAVPGARRAILAERVLAILPERRTWLLGVERDPSFDESEERGRDREIATLLLEAMDLDGHVTCLVASAEGRVLLARLAEIPGLVIWERGR